MSEDTASDFVMGASVKVTFPSWLSSLHTRSKGIFLGTSLQRKTNA